MWVAPYLESITLHDWKENLISERLWENETWHFTWKNFIDKNVTQIGMSQKQPNSASYFWTCSSIIVESWKKFYHCKKSYSQLKTQVAYTYYICYHVQAKTLKKDANIIFLWVSLLFFVISAAYRNSPNAPKCISSFLAYFAHPLYPHMDWGVRQIPTKISKSY